MIMATLGRNNDTREIEMSKSIPWQLATVEQIITETPRTKSVILRLPDFTPHLAGQHYNLRLTAADGYTAMRSYSVASGMDGKDRIQLTIDRVPDGEVSEFIHDVLEVDDQLEVRGPIGGYFVWKPEISKKILLIGGGSGIVPLMSIIRSQNGERKVKLLYSSQSPETTIYYDELNELAKTPWFNLDYTYTRSQPENWKGFSRRVDHDMIADFTLKDNLKEYIAYVCGPTPFVEFVANTLKKEGMMSAYIRTERFGPNS